MKSGQTLLVAVFLMSFTKGMAQVGINTTNPRATLDISAANASSPAQNDGLLLPRVNTFPSTNPSSSQEGMLVYLTTDLTGFVVNATAKDYKEGFYFWDHAQTDWIPLVVNKAWKLDGNDDAVSGTDFIGTTNSEEVDFRVNNTLVARLTQLGQFELQSADRSLFIGFEAGENYDGSSSAEHDTFIGYQAGNSNTSGRDNTAIGTFALRSNVNGSFNTAVGDEALLSSSAGFRNTGVGGAAIRDNISGDRNTGIGFDALRENTSGDGNTAVGNSAFRNGDGFSNSTAIGNNAAFINYAANLTAVGAFVLENNNTGANNTAVGTFALRAATADNNVALGTNAGSVVTFGDNNVLLGTDTDVTSGTLNNTTVVGYNASAGGDNVVSIGSNSSASANNAIAIGDDSGAEDQWAIAIGEFSRARGEDAIALGHRSTVDGYRGASLGLNADIGSSGSNAIAIGVDTRALHSGSIALGRGAVTTANNQLKLSGDITTVDASSAVITAESYVATVGSSTGYADYVFDIYYDGRSDLTTHYTFPSLDEAEAFVKLHGHLIGVKSIEDIEKQGMKVDVTEVSLKNLEKLEEQFLYITELHARLKAAESALQKHEEKIDYLIQAIQRLSAGH